MIPLWLYIFGSALLSGPTTMPGEKVFFVLIPMREIVQPIFAVGIGILLRKLKSASKKQHGGEKPWGQLVSSIYQQVSKHRLRPHSVRV